MADNPYEAPRAFDTSARVKSHFWRWALWASIQLVGYGSAMYVLVVVALWFAIVADPSYWDRPETPLFIAAGFVVGAFGLTVAWLTWGLARVARPPASRPHATT